MRHEMALYEGGVRGELLAISSEVSKDMLDDMPRRGKVLAVTTGTDVADYVDEPAGSPAKASRRARAVRQKVVRPLKGLKVAPYYGCQIVRPYATFDDQFNPVTMDKLLPAPLLHPAAPCQ